MQWEQIYAELLNKFRWSIASTMGGQGFNYSFRESLALASVLAGDALTVMKEKDDKPELRQSAEDVKRFLAAKG